MGTGKFGHLLLSPPDIGQHVAHGTYSCILD